MMTRREVINGLKCAIDLLEQEPFINKDCVSKGACHEDKVNVLDKIMKEIEEIETYDGTYVDRAFVLQIIDKYLAANVVGCSASLAVNTVDCSANPTESEEKVMLSKEEF